MYGSTVFQISLRFLKRQYAAHTLRIALNAQASDGVGKATGKLSAA
jgi:hypothetical protein